MNAIAHFRFVPGPPDLAALRQTMINEVRHFEQACQRLGLSDEEINGARYCLCSSLDEAAALTEWGKSDIWAGNGLLLTFHNETHGGEKFFQIMDTLSQQPDKHTDLLELIYFCLMLGFGGRYRVIENGIYRLQIITLDLARQLRKTKGEYAAPLSLPLFSPVTPRRAGRPGLLLLSVLLVGLAASTTYIWLNQRLERVAERVQEQLYGLPLPKAKPPFGGISLAALRQHFKDDIASGKMDIVLREGNIVISLCGGDLFGSARARLNAGYKPVISQLARLMLMHSGPIIVTGYSDNQKIRTPEYPSNEALSLARAEAVARLLRCSLRPSQRVLAESAADAAPLLPNNTAKNRAINRRIEIVFPLTVLNAADGGRE
ncbi:type IVB secretion system protein IcmH/DotU [Sodalis ligni]|nr:type IVB secretion system protein IcmH/DotU [Sodalis ligni]